MEVSHEQRRQIDDLVRQGQRIAAIKLHREFTGSDLKAARDAIEAMEAGAQTEERFDSTAPALSGDQLSRVRELVDKNSKIEAIKLYRELTGVGLKEAKDAVEQMEGRRGVESLTHIQSTSLDLGRIAVVILLVLMVVGAVLYFSGLADRFLR
jgi:ribosomal protein L7/L12